MDKLAELEKELLEEMEAKPEAYEVQEQTVCVIDNNLRTINIPPDLKNLGVESDDDVHRIFFQMPKSYGEFDLAEFDIRINYKNGNIGDVYAVEDKAAETDVLTFSWLVGRNAVKTKGQTQFIVCLKKTDVSGNVIQELNTTVASLNVLEGLETTEKVVQENPDVIEQILKRLDGVTEIPQEQIQEAVEVYLLEHPIQETDPTVPEWAKQPQKPSYTAEEVGARPNTWTPTAKDVGALPKDTEIPTVPEKLPNPNPLTFTGAVTGSYDGSEAVNIDIPISSGGGDEKKVIYNQVLTENVGFVSVPFSEFSGCKRIICKIYIPKMEEETYKNYLIRIKLADTEAWSSGAVFAYSKDISTNTNHLLLMCSMFIVNEKAHFENMFYMDQYTKNPNNLINAASVQNLGYYLTTQNTSIYFEINNRTYLLPIGTEITILGY